MTDIAPKLLPCPFCGGEGAKLRTDPKGAMSWVSCPECGLEAPTETGVCEGDAVEYWNRRASPSQVAPQPQAGEARASKCPGADDPEDRCPRHPDDCTCWQVDLDHPTVRASKRLAKQPANPAQVGGSNLAERAKAVRGDLEAHNFDDVIALLDDYAAAIGAGGQAVACKECDGTGFKDKNGARLTLARTPCGACGGGGYVAALSQHHPADEHPDDIAVDRFATAMKAKLKWERENRNRSGWQAMSAADLSRILYDHLPKGDPVDVANLSMMLHQNGQQIEPHPADERVVDAMVEAAYEAFTSLPTGTRSPRADLRAALTAAIGAGGQAVAIISKAEAKLAAYAFDEDEETEFSREDAVFVLSALSQPRPADERVVEALEPFATFAESAVEKTDDGWQWANFGNDRICDWFGPSDFGAALSVKEGRS